MQKSRASRIVASVGLIVSMATTAVAAPIEADGKPVARPAQGEAAARLSMARQLAEYGVSQKDPLAVLAAANIMQSTPTTAISPARTVEGGQADAGKKEASAPTEVPGLLAKAKEYAAGRSDLIAIADDIAAAKPRGDIEGPNRHRDAVQARATDVYQITFQGGERAAVYVDGDGDTDLDLYIVGPSGRTVCEDTDNTDTMLCEFWVPRTATYQVRIKNYGSVYNEYVLLTN